MRSLQHVLWRGALALSLMAIGVGSGLGMPSAEQATSPDACPHEARALVADEIRGDRTGEQGTTLVLPRRALSPAG